MPVSNPYYAICRPFPDGSFAHNLDESYFVDNRYAPSRSHLLRAYGLLERDLKRLFDFIEPADGNLGSFSHELYQLLLRASTEVETNATAILTLNGYTSPRTNWNVKDYAEVEKACRLSQYQVRLSVWRGSPKIFTPYAAWATMHTLPWYQDYNTVKHDRSQEFEKASFENVLNAVAGVLVILFAQFYLVAFDRYRPASGMYHEDGGWLSGGESPFELSPPTSWSPADQYDFDWKVLKGTATPFQKFTF